jgi:uncharacterized membrane protein
VVAKAHTHFTWRAVFLAHSTDLLVLASGSLVGFVLGLIGGGGSVLAVPLLVYLVGVRDPHVAIGTSAIAVRRERLRESHWPCESWPRQMELRDGFRARRGWRRDDRFVDRQGCQW